MQLLLLRPLLPALLLHSSLLALLPVSLEQPRLGQPELVDEPLELQLPAVPLRLPLPPPLWLLASQLLGLALAVSEWWAEPLERLDLEQVLELVLELRVIE